MMRASTLSDINCVKGEIHNVLTMMRLNTRWASADRFIREIPLQSESSLTRGLKALHDQLTLVSSLVEVDTVHYLQPFVDIVTSHHTSGPITGAALSSIHKFLLYGFISKDSPRVRESINLVAVGISKCVFEETDQFGDEVVLMKLLELSALCLRCDAGFLLTADSVCALFFKCLLVASEPSLKAAAAASSASSSASAGRMRSRLLRSTAENTLAHIVLVAFSRARARGSAQEHPPTFFEGWGGGEGGGGRCAAGNSGERLAGDFDEEEDCEWPDLSDHDDGDDDGGGGGENWGTKKSNGGGGGGYYGGSGDSGRRGQHRQRHRSGGEGRRVDEQKSSNNGNSNGNNSAIVRIMTALSVLCNPRPPTALSSSRGGGGSKGHGDEEKGGEGGGARKAENALLELLASTSGDEATCALALSLVNIALEAGGEHLGKHRELVAVMQGNLCKHLLQNSQSSSASILSLTLRVVFNLFNSIKDHLKVQLEVFLTSVHLRLLDQGASGQGGSQRSSTLLLATPEALFSLNERRELALESLVEFCREPALMLDLYVNYDCDVQCTNLFEFVCTALALHATPWGPKQRSTRNRVVHQFRQQQQQQQPETMDAFAFSSSAFSFLLPLRPGGGLPAAPACSLLNVVLGGWGRGGGRGLNSINRLALEGLLAVIGSISSQCRFLADDDDDDDFSDDDSNEFEYEDVGSNVVQNEEHGVVGALEEEEGPSSIHPRGRYPNAPIHVVTTTTTTNTTPATTPPTGSSVSSDDGGGSDRAGGGVGAHSGGGGGGGCARGCGGAAPSSPIPSGLTSPPPSPAPPSVTSYNLESTSESEESDVGRSRQCRGNGGGYGGGGGGGGHGDVRFDGNDADTFGLSRSTSLSTGMGSSDDVGYAMAAVSRSSSANSNTSGFSDSRHHQYGEGSGGRDRRRRRRRGSLLKVPSNRRGHNTASAKNQNRGDSDHNSDNQDGEDGCLKEEGEAEQEQHRQQLEFLALAREKTARVLQQRKRVKRRLGLLAERFNSDESLKKFIPFAQELGLLPSPPSTPSPPPATDHGDGNVNGGDPFPLSSLSASSSTSSTSSSSSSPALAVAVARLLKDTPGMDKTQVGLFIGKGPADKYPLHAAVLASYAELFDFRGLTFDQSFRVFLEEFRLPGEAQCIDRIMEAFAKEAFKQCPEIPFASADAAFVLSFSLIMLNTDLHNPNIPTDRKMTLTQFMSQNRDTNGGEPFNTPFMRSLYFSIKDSEIVVRSGGATIMAAAGGAGGANGHGKGAGGSGGGGDGGANGEGASDGNGSGGNGGGAAALRASEEMMGALETGRLEWGRLISTKNQSMASASFTPSRLTARRRLSQRRATTAKSNGGSGGGRSHRRSREKVIGSGLYRRDSLEGREGVLLEEGGERCSGGKDEKEQEGLTREENDHDEDDEENDEDNEEEEEPLYLAGLHERDMFASIADGCFDALLAVLGATTDDFLVLKALQGLYRFAAVSHYYSFSERVNGVVILLLDATRRYFACPHVAQLFKAEASATSLSLTSNAAGLATAASCGGGGGDGGGGSDSSSSALPEGGGAAPVKAFATTSGGGGGGGGGSEQSSPASQGAAAALMLSSAAAAATVAAAAAVSANQAAYLQSASAVMDNGGNNDNGGGGVAASAAAAASLPEGAMRVLLAAPVPLAALKPDLARLPLDHLASAGYHTWGPAVGAAPHVGIVTLHAALEVMVDFGFKGRRLLSRATCEAFALTLFSLLDLDALPPSLCRLSDLVLPSPPLPPDNPRGPSSSSTSFSSASTLPSPTLASSDDWPLPPSRFGCRCLPQFRAQLRWKKRVHGTFGMSGAGGGGASGGASGQGGHTEGHRQPHPPTAANPGLLSSIAGYFWAGGGEEGVGEVRGGCGVSRHLDAAMPTAESLGTTATHPNTNLPVSQTTAATTKTAGAAAARALAAGVDEGRYTNITNRPFGGNDDGTGVFEAPPATGRSVQSTLRDVLRVTLNVERMFPTPTLEHCHRGHYETGNGSISPLQQQQSRARHQHGRHRRQGGGRRGARGGVSGAGSGEACGPPKLSLHALGLVCHALVDRARKDPLLSPLLAPPPLHSSSTSSSFDSKSVISNSSSSANSNASCSSLGNSSVGPSAAAEEAAVTAAAAASAVGVGRFWNRGGAAAAAAVAAEAEAAAATLAAEARSEGHAVLALELVTRLLLANRHRIFRDRISQTSTESPTKQSPSPPSLSSSSTLASLNCNSNAWEALLGFWARILGSRKLCARMPFLCERALVSVLQVWASLTATDTATDTTTRVAAARQQLCDTLSLALRGLPQEYLESVNDRLAKGVLVVLVALAARASGSTTLTTVRKGSGGGGGALSSASSSRLPSSLLSSTTEVLSSSAAPPSSSSSSSWQTPVGATTTVAPTTATTSTAERAHRKNDGGDQTQWDSVFELLGTAAQSHALGRPIVLDALALMLCQTKTKTGVTQQQQQQQQQAPRGAMPTTSTAVAGSSIENGGQNSGVDGVGSRLNSGPRRCTRIRRRRCRQYFHVGSPSLLKPCTVRPLLSLLVRLSCVAAWVRQHGSSSGTPPVANPPPPPAPASTSTRRWAGSLFKGGRGEKRSVNNGDDDNTDDADDNACDGEWVLEEEAGEGGGIDGNIVELVPPPTAANLVYVARALHLLGVLSTHLAVDLAAHQDYRRFLLIGGSSNGDGDDTSNDGDDGDGDRRYQHHQQQHQQQGELLPPVATTPNKAGQEQQQTPRQGGPEVRGEGDQDDFNDHEEEEEEEEERRWALQGSLTGSRHPLRVWRVWRVVLGCLRAASELPHLDTVKVACDTLQKMLVSDSCARLLLALNDEDEAAKKKQEAEAVKAWDWVFNEVLFKLGPLLRVETVAAHNSGAGSRQLDSAGESRALLCTTVLSRALLHHMPWLMHACPPLFEAAALKLVALQASLFRCTHSEAVGEALMNMLSVVQSEVMAHSSQQQQQQQQQQGNADEKEQRRQQQHHSWQDLVPRARALVDSLCPSLSQEMHARAPGLHPSSSTAFALHLQQKQKHAPPPLPPSFSPSPPAMVWGVARSPPPPTAGSLAAKSSMETATTAMRPAAAAAAAAPPLTSLAEAATATKVPLRRAPPLVVLSLASPSRAPPVRTTTVAPVVEPVMGRAGGSSFSPVAPSQRPPSSSAAMTSPLSSSSSTATAAAATAAPSMAPSRLAVLKGNGDKGVEQEQQRRRQQTEVPAAAVVVPPLRAKPNGPKDARSSPVLPVADTSPFTV